MQPIAGWRLWMEAIHEAGCAAWQNGAEVLANHDHIRSNFVYSGRRPIPLGSGGYKTALRHRFAYSV